VVAGKVAYPAAPTWFLHEGRFPPHGEFSERCARVVPLLLRRRTFCRTFSASTGDFPFYSSFTVTLLLRNAGLPTVGFPAVPFMLEFWTHHGTGCHPFRLPSDLKLGYQAGMNMRNDPQLLLLEARYYYSIILVITAQLPWDLFARNNGRTSLKSRLCLQDIAERPRPLADLASDLGRDGFSRDAWSAGYTPGETRLDPDQRPSSDAEDLSVDFDALPPLPRSLGLASDGSSDLHGAPESSSSFLSTSPLDVPYGCPGTNAQAPLFHRFFLTPCSAGREGGDACCGRAYAAAHLQLTSWFTGEFFVSMYDMRACFYSLAFRPWFCLLWFSVFLWEYPSGF
jgi:hypothetical protein